VKKLRTETKRGAASEKAMEPNDPLGTEMAERVTWVPTEELNRREEWTASAAIRRGS